MKVLQQLDLLQEKKITGYEIQAEPKWFNRWALIIYYI